MKLPQGKELVAFVANRHGITEGDAAGLISEYAGRARKHRFSEGWWLELLDAQYQTHIGSYRRIRCGAETHLEHLIPDADRLCHDCGCALSEFHVFGCDAEVVSGGTFFVSALPRRSSSRHAARLQARNPRPQNHCAQCGDIIFLPEWSEYLDRHRVRHLWECEACGYKFETLVSFAEA